MLGSEAYADRVDAVVGTKMLTVLLGKLHRWRAQNAGHPALQVPEAEAAREQSFGRLERFFKLDIQMEEALPTSKLPS